MNISHEELLAKYPSADPEREREVAAAARLEGDLVELVYRMRTHAGLTQAELEERMGAPESTITDIEEFDTIPTIETIAQISRATGIPLRLIADDVFDIHLGEDRTPDEP